MIQQAIAVLKGFSVPMMTVLQWCSHFLFEDDVELVHTFLWVFFLNQNPYHPGLFCMVNLGRYSISHMDAMGKLPIQ